MWQLNCKSDKFEIEINPRSCHTVICGNSGSGATFLFKTLKSIKTLKDVYFIDYESVKDLENYKLAVEYIRSHSNQFIIINNADDIQRISDEIMYAINTDKGANKFVVIGRNPKLIYNISDLAEVSIKDNKISLSYLFPEPLIIKINLNL